MAGTAMTAGLSAVFYKEALEHCHTFNARLMTERQVRLPYLDSQTGVAQNNCNLLFEKRHRGPGLQPNQVYTYPSKHWKKKPRSTPLLDIPFGPLSTTEATTTGAPPSALGAVENQLINENSNDSSNQAIDFDAASDIQDAGGDEFADDDDDYYDEDSRHRKRARKTRGRSGRPPRRADRDEEKDKPHPCVYCGKRYKNKPGLNYHIQRYHQDEVDGDDEYTPGGMNTPSLTDQDSNQGMSGKSNLPSSRAGSVAGSNIADDLEEEEKSTRSRRKRQAINSAYCDFCLGDADENKKTGEPEELISCSDCGRSGHPTCLQFTDIMTMNVKKYRWQCIECKSCHVCGTSDNDDQLLFCDDCDRGYHMYCLNPPMQEPPEGSWICSLCEADRKVREGQTGQGVTATNL